MDKPRRCSTKWNKPSTKRQCLLEIGMFRDRKQITGFQELEEGKIGSDCLVGTVFAWVMRKI
jgi:hypothetical protein